MMVWQMWMYINFPVCVLATIFLSIGEKKWMIGWTNASAQVLLASMIMMWNGI